MFGDGAEEFDDVGEMILVPTVVLTRVRLK